MSKHIDPTILPKILRYDAETGKLFWKERDESFFKGRPSRSAEWQARAWNEKNAGNEAFTARSRGYFVGAVLGRVVQASRVIWAIHHGEWPEIIDHIDGDPSNNLLANLRSVDRPTNQRNMKVGSNSKHGHRGISWDKSRSRWRATMKIKGRRGICRRFKKFDDAVAARKKMERDYGFHENHGKR